MSEVDIGFLYFKAGLIRLTLFIFADMAPRKRTTRQRKNDPKTAKLEAFLQDFDSEGKYVVLRKDWFVYLVHRQPC